MFKILFSYRFKPEGKLWEYKILLADEKTKDEHYKKIVDRYGMYTDFKINVLTS